MAVTFYPLYCSGRILIKTKKEPSLIEFLENLIPFYVKIFIRKPEHFFKVIVLFRHFLLIHFKSCSDDTWH